MICTVFFFNGANLVAYFNNRVESITPVNVPLKYWAIVHLDFLYLLVQLPTMIALWKYDSYS